MWIRTQNKHGLLDATGKTLYVGRIGSIKNCILADDYIIAQYSTEEKAVEVLDQLQHSLINGSSVNNYEYEYSGSDKLTAIRHCEEVFEMPKEKKMNKPVAMDELGEDLCDYCSLEKEHRGTHTNGNGEPTFCSESSFCEEAYQAYLAQLDAEQEDE